MDAFSEQMVRWSCNYKKLRQGSFADNNVRKQKRMAAFSISYKWTISLVFFSAESGKEGRMWLYF